MGKYQTLKEMKIKSPLDIVRYSVQTVDNIDWLRVVYKRKKRSFLPESKQFRFPRIKKTIMENSGTRKTDTRWEVSPFLEKAISELDQLLSDNISKKKMKAVIRDELKSLEEEAHMRVIYIRGLIDEL